MGQQQQAGVVELTPEQERDLIEDTATLDPGSEGDVSQDPGFVPEDCSATVAGPAGSDTAEVPT